MSGNLLNRDLVRDEHLVQEDFEILIQRVEWKVFSQYSPRKLSQSFLIGSQLIHE